MPADRANSGTGAVPETRSPKPETGAMEELLRQVRRIELRTERLVSSLAAGRIRSTFKGSGLEFDEGARIRRRR